MLFRSSDVPRAEMKGSFLGRSQKTSKPGSRSAKTGCESSKPDPESAQPSHVHERPIPPKCSWSHLDPKSFEMSLLSLLFDVFSEGFRKAIFHSVERRQPRSLAHELWNPAKKLRSLAQILRSPGREPRSLNQPTEIAHFRRSLALRRRAPFTEIASLCRSPVPRTRSPAPKQRSPARTMRSPIATHAREVGLRALVVLCWASLFRSKNLERQFWTPPSQSQNCEAQAI